MPWAMISSEQQIAEWLEQLGMSEYAQRFTENDIDLEVVGELTDADFDRLGVSIGHRRKLLKALAAGVPAAAATPSKSSTADSAERRQVTVMFSDLVGSTALSARMDPEDLRDGRAEYARAEKAEAMLQMGVRAEQQALAKWGLNYVIDEYLPRKLANEKAFLP
jgi:hypothetical protein